MGEQERVIIVEPLEAPDPVEPDVVPTEPEPDPVEEPATEELGSSRTWIRAVS